MSGRRPTEPTERGAVGRTLLSMVAISAFCGVLVAGLLLPVASLVGITTRNVAEGFQELPLELRKTPIPQRTTVLDAAGKPIAYFYSENRQDIPLSDVSPRMRRAVVAIEDSRFFEHGAIDVKGTIRAFVNNAANGATQGGSSITQQLVKLTLIEQADTYAERKAATEPTFARKLRELQYAMAYEQTHTKNEILRNYLNIAYFGDRAYGIDAAADHYFSVDASQLNLRQSALLAGLVKNPTAYDPTNYPQEAIARRNIVLMRMADLGIIGDKIARKAAKKRLGLDLTPFNNGCVSTEAPFFCDYVRRYLLEEDLLGDTRDEREHKLETAGLTIKTTLDSRMQEAADTSVGDHVFPGDDAIGGLALLEPGTGEVRALSQSRPMGSKKKLGQTYLNYLVPREYGDSGGFQAGSTFKAFTLAAALRQGYPTDTKIFAPQVYQVKPFEFRTCEGTWPVPDEIENSTGAGTFDMYAGTQKSVNTYYVQLEKMTGICPPVQLARAMDIDVPDADIVPSFTLGVTSVSPLEMAAAYATFPARGIYCAPHPVTEILDQDGEPIATVEDDCERLFKPAVADAVNDILRGVQEPPSGFGYLNGLELNVPSAAKTGTITANRAVWYMGYTPKLVTAAMIAGANRQGHPITLKGASIAGNTISDDAAFGSTLAGPMWYDAMRVIQQYLPNVDFHPVNEDALGSKTGTVPDVAGKTVEEASNLLREAGYLPQIQSAVDSSYAEGSVAYTSPSAGSELPKGSTVLVYPSTGSTPYTPPPTTSAPPETTPPSPTASPGGGGGGGGDPGGGNPGGGNGNGPGGGGPPGRD